MQSRFLKGYSLGLSRLVDKLFILLALATVVCCAIAIYQLGHEKVVYSWWDGGAPDTHWLRKLFGSSWLVVTVVGVVFARLLWLIPISLIGLGIAAATNNSATAWIWWGLSVLTAGVVNTWWMSFKPSASQASGSQASASAQNPHEAESAPVAGPKAMKPSRDFSAIHGMSEVKAHLLDAASKALAKGSDANGILLYGEPGNGKTVIAEALAGELGKKWISISVADIVSRWIGAGPEQLKAAFNAAQAQAPCVLFIDEADSVFASREGDGVHQDQINLTNVFLTEVVRLRGKGVLVIAATNSLDRLDAAAIREGRFDFKVEITAPDYEARLGLLRDGLKRNAPAARVEEAVLANVAKRWVGFSVSRLIAVTKQAQGYMAEHKTKDLDYDALVACLRRVQGRKDLVAEDAKTLDQLVLARDQRLVLQGIADRMKTTFETEQLGGSLPNGVLFWGPPGTGKTEAARALAKGTGWAFLTTSGHDLLAKPEAIDQLYKKAKDARPAIVFIDEADDVLGDRQFSGVKNVTNKLLTIMDGVGGKVPDLLFVAATNHPASMDPAVLRGGRFTEKVEFSPPQDDDVRVFVEQWLKGKGWELRPDCGDVVDVVAGQSIANIAAMLQAAINLSIAESRSSGVPVEKRISAKVLQLAIATVAPDLN